MTTHPQAETLRYALLPRTGLLTDALLVVGGAGLVAACAQISIPLGFTPVPITGQTFAVVLVGASLGSIRGAASLLDFLDAERSYRATELAYRQSLAAYLLALEQLREAVGTRSLP